MIKALGYRDDHVRATAVPGARTKRGAKKQKYVKPLW